MSTVLVVEDDPFIRANISEELTAEGYSVLRAADADSAIKILESRNDVRTVFTDIEMPGSIDGLKLAAAVRDRWPPINIIITTGRRVPAREEMPENSVFIPKPYQSAQVAEALRSFA